MSDLVWYVAYGSNLSADRFACYLAGGVPAGARRATPGARDGTLARAWQRVEVPHPLWFGGPSLTWDGGPAFLDVTSAGTTVGRAWLVTREQFADVAAQENGVDPGGVTVTDRHLATGGTLVDSTYGRVAVLPSPDHRPAVTVTCPTLPPWRAPDPAYVALIRTGLRECGLTGEEAEAVLAPATRPR